MEELVTRIELTHDPDRPEGRRVHLVAGTVSGEDLLIEASSPEEALRILADMLAGDVTEPHDEHCWEYVGLMATTSWGDAMVLSCTYLGCGYQRTNGRAHWFIRNEYAERARDEFERSLLEATTTYVFTLGE
jgi:hypothetical protein